MADYVLLGGAPLNDRIRVVVHSTVPGGNNEVGVAWSQALVDHLGDTTSVVPASILPAGRQAALDTGSVYEWEFTFVDDANATPAARQSNLETEIQIRESAEITRLQGILRYFGKTGSVA
jgi:hypothetical protein